MICACCCRAAVCPDEMVLQTREESLLQGQPQGLTVLQVLIADKHPLPWIRMVLDAGAAINGAGGRGQVGEHMPPWFANACLPSKGRSLPAEPSSLERSSSSVVAEHPAQRGSGAPGSRRHQRPGMLSPAGEAGSYGPPLLMACAFGNAGATRELLSRGADLRVRGTQGATVLVAASKHPECMRQVLDAMQAQLSQVGVSTDSVARRGQRCPLLRCTSAMLLDWGYVTESWLLQLLLPCLWHDAAPLKSSPSRVSSMAAQRL